MKGGCDSLGLLCKCDKKRVLCQKVVIYWPLCYGVNRSGSYAGRL